MSEDGSRSPVGSPTVGAYLVLVASRWLPTGLLIPVLVLLMQERGLTLGQIGLALAVQGLMVFLLELPTGGLADTIGRRPVLLVAAGVEFSAVCVLLVADSVALLAVVFLLQGIYRSLESGPLEAWFVSGYRPGPDEPEPGTVLARAGATTGVAIAAGSLLSGGLVWWHPVGSASVLALPVAVAAGLRLVDLALIAALMRESRPGRSLQVGALLGDAGVVVTETIHQVRTSLALAGLIAVEFCWGFGMTAFETLFPPRLAEVTGSADDAASLLGPVGAAAWLVAAAGASVAPTLARRLGLVNAAMVGQALQAAAIVGIALVAGAVGAVAFYLATLMLHGAINPLYRTALHEHADDEHRTTILSASSMAAHPGGAIGGIVLGALATATSVSVAMIAGAAMLAAAVPMYLPARLRSSEGVGAAVTAPSSSSPELAERGAGE